MINIEIDETKLSDEELSAICESIGLLKNPSENMIMELKLPWMDNYEFTVILRSFLDMLKPLDDERIRRIDAKQAKAEYEQYLELKKKYEGKVLV